MLRQFFRPAPAPTQAQDQTQPMRAIKKPGPDTEPIPTYRPRKRRQIPWYGWLSIIVLMLLGMSALGLFAYQTWEFVSWLFPNESFGYRILALVNFDIFSTVWLCLHLFVILRHGAKVASVIAGGIDLFLSLLCTVIQLMRQGAEQLYGVYRPDPNLIATGMAVVVLALLVNFIALLAVLYAQWPYISGQIYEEEEEVYSPPPTQVQTVYSPAQVQTQPSAEMEMVKMMFQLVLAGQQGGTQTAQLPFSTEQQERIAPVTRQASARKGPAVETEDTTPMKKSLPRLKTTRYQVNTPGRVKQTTNGS